MNAGKIHQRLGWMLMEVALQALLAERRMRLLKMEVPWVELMRLEALWVDLPAQVAAWKVGAKLGLWGLANR